jgi:hypothetical protein
MPRDKILIEAGQSRMERSIGHQQFRGRTTEMSEIQPAFSGEGVTSQFQIGESSAQSQ